MAIRSTTPRRQALMGLAVAGALAGTAGPAAAQYYGYDDDVIVYRYGYRDDGYRDFGFRYRPAPRAPVALPARSVSRIALRDFGLVQVERTLRSGESYIVDGQAANGRRARLILDAYSGDLIDRIALPPAHRTTPEVARADPREIEQPARPRLVPRPPERPAALKPPAQATAPATVIPPAPAAAPPRAPEPETPAEPAPPVSASAPATTLPAPAPAEVAPAPEAAREPAPKLVNPEDVRGTEGTDRLPPLAKALSGSGSADPAGMPPVQTEDPAPSVPKAETPIAPVTPLE